MVSFVLSDSAAASFGRSFLEHYLVAGFGVLPKRQVDLLVFHLLEQSGAIRGMSNYDIASNLGITEVKVRGLRRDATLRFGDVDREEAMSRIVERLFMFGETRAVADNGLVTFELEDPILQREFEQAARDLGYFTDTSFNRSLIRVPLHVFVAVMAESFEDASVQAARIVGQELKRLDKADAAVAKGLPLGDRIEWLLNKHEKKIDLAKALLAPLKLVLGKPA